MLQANQNNNSVLTVSPPDSGFSPRPEFVRDSHAPSTFALLSIAGASFIRLSSFSQDILSNLRYALESQSLLKSIREDPNLRLIEFSLDGKPWAQSKSPESERLFVQVLAIIFRHGYRFLSTIDYGRESSERVCIAFSRPATLTAYEAARVPFALSFPSSRVLRVVNPPLNSTPAILQAARTAWPRGVVSEKKVSNGCYEFRLKGYGLFREDTFSTDSMKHILSLLNALDRYAFTLLTSISLTGSHSRVKDLWVFSGSPMEAPYDPGASTSNVELPVGAVPTVSKNAFTPARTSSSQAKNHSADTLHGKGGSLPGSSQESSHAMGHVRSATEPNAIVMTRTSSVLRKRSPPKPSRSLPSGQSPYSRSSEEFPLRRNKLSTIGSVDMTGIGSANQRNFYAARGRDDSLSASPRDFPRSSAGSDSMLNQYNPAPERGRVKTGEFFYETGHNLQARRSRSPGDSGSGSGSRPFSPQTSLEPPNDVPQSVSDRVTSNASSLAPPILGSRVFRDSAFSSATNQSVEVPITWTGADDTYKGKERESVPRKPAALERDSSSPETDEGYGGSVESGAVSAKRSSTPKVHGAWQPSPIKEMPEDQGGLASSMTSEKPHDMREGSLERKEVNAERVASPTFSDTAEATRKSEVAHYGTVTSPVLHRMGEERHQSGRTVSSPSRPDGWVLVNVVDGTTDSSSEPPTSPSFARSSVERERSRSSHLVGSSPSPLAKSIVVEDAKQVAYKKSQSASGLKRLFSGSKMKSQQPHSSSEEVTGRKRNLSFMARWRKKNS